MCKLTLFGAPSLVCKGRAIHISRRKSWALLAYLSVSRQTHSREALVTLLWPEYDPRQGRADLSRILSTLRKALGAGYFLTDRESVALNEDAGLWVDVVQFREHVDACPETVVPAPGNDCHQKLTAAAALYKADFLTGFTLPDCPEFDEWQLLQTESLRRELGWVLERVARIHEAENDLLQAIAYARRWVNVDSLHEPARRLLMTLLARNGQRAAAHRQYHDFQRLLADTLGIEPHSITRELYERIRTSDDVPMQSLASDRAPLFSLAETHHEPEPPFVGRQHEIARLDSALQRALEGKGQIMFVTGGAGRGKTSLLQAFARRAQERYPDLIVTGGSGVAVTGIGDPYLPFREVMALLSGDFATARGVGQLNREQARRLWALMPQVARAIVSHGPQLLGVFVSGVRLLSRLATVVPDGPSWLHALRKEVTQREGASGERAQIALFGQFGNVLRYLAQKRPLLILLDDLQWLDAASTGLLFYLSRHLQDSRIMIVAAYRPDEVQGAAGGSPHPLRQVIEESGRRFGDIFIDLARADEAEGRSLLDALLDTEPNRLEEAFRQALFQKTGGHPLFTVELLHDMQSRGDLFKDETGRWCAQHSLHWDTLPARVEAVIARRVGLLDDDAREILSVASVEGELFTVEVVARLLGRDERSLLRILSQQLQREQRLLKEAGEAESGGRYFSLYHFSHALVRQYIYGLLSQGERRRRHAEVAQALETLYEGHLDQMVVQLAHHYTVAADWNRAVYYLLRSGDLAYDKASMLEAARHYQAALSHWPANDASGKTDTLRKLGECLWISGRHAEAIEALQDAYALSLKEGDAERAAAAQQWLGRVYWEMGQMRAAAGCYRQALSLLEGKEESEALAAALAGLAAYDMHVGNYESSIALGRRALALARRLEAEGLMIRCLCDLGSALSGMGDWTGVSMERESLARALALNRPHDAGRAYLYIAEALIYLGKYDEARQLLAEALAYTRRMHVPYITTGLQRQLALVDWLTGQWTSAPARLQDLDARLRQEQQGGMGRLYVAIDVARLYNDLGQAEKARSVLAAAEMGAVSSLDPRVAFLGELARAEMAAGRVAEAVSFISEILEWSEQAPHLFPNVARALLFICSAPLVYNQAKLAPHARAAYQQLQRLDRQYGSPITKAYQLEGQGWLSLAEADMSEAIASFRKAVAGWQSVGRPHDQARALRGLSRALLTTGDAEGARAASEQGMSLAESLATQLDDPLLKTTYLSTASALAA